MNIAQYRLFHQHVAGKRLRTPGDIVKWMGAIQAQDYHAGLWAVALRTQEGTRDSVERAIAGREIIRTWPMRGTLHFVATSDVRWMLKYLTPRMVTRAAFRFRQLRLSDATFSQCRRILAKTLDIQKRLTRDEVYTLFERNHVSCKGQRGIHILWRLAQEGLICHGPRNGKQYTFVLLEEWIPTTRMIPRQEALAEFAGRYFASHGPATLQDFSWWAGLTIAEARSSLEEVKSRLVFDTIDGQTYWSSGDTLPRTRISSATVLLPPFDEYLVGYQNRTAIVDRRYAKRMDSGGGILNPTIVIDGKIVGTWKRTIKRDQVEIQVYPFSRLSKSQRNEVSKAAESYGAFWGKVVKLAIGT